MKKLITKLMLAVVLLGSAGAASAASTWYVRTDGGTATQCTGAADAAYDGAGTGEACAWKSIAYALGTNGGGATRIAGGDTVIVKNGSYPIGYHTNFDITGCTTGSKSTCYLKAPPSGPSAAQPTRIIGQYADIGCMVAPEFWGTGGVNRVINIQGASNVTIECLEITDHSSCVSKHWDPAKLCASNTGDWAYQGFRGQAASNWVLRRVNVHGMAHFGMYISGLTDWNTEYLRIHANGFGGWNGEVSNNSGDYNFGTMRFKNAEISWNGCTENYPSLAIHACIGANGDDYDGSGTAKTRTAGSDGYGDGIGTGHTGGTWIFEDSVIHHNVQEGIDMLYLTQSGGNVTVRRTRAFGNAGNQVKLSGISTVENNVIIGNCDFFATPQRYYPAMTIASGDSCRASGNALVIRPYPQAGISSTVRNNTITGVGDVLVNISTGFGADYNGANSSTIVRFENNIFLGQTDYGGTWLTNLYANTGDGTPTRQWDSNTIWNVNTASEYCPTGSSCGSAPPLTNITISGFDPRPTSEIAGNTSLSTTTDLFGRARGATATRGAIDYAPGQ